MSPCLLLITAALYAGVAADLFLNRSPAMALCFTCYAIANCALTWAIWKP